MKGTLLLSVGIEIGMAGCASAGQPVTFTTESYPPFSYRDSDGSFKGISVEQVQIIIQDVEPTSTLEMMPWARAIALAETQERHCVFAAARTPDRETRFKWIVPLYVDHNILVGRTGGNIQAATLDEARRQSVGTHREDYTEKLLKDLGFENVDLSAGVDITLGKLLGGRIDLMPMSESVYRHLRKDGKPVEKVITLTEQVLGIACNRNMPDEIISGMQSRLDRMISDGTQREIDRRYGIDSAP